MNAWRLLVTWDADPGLNMGLDEALLEGTGPPTLRLYSWSPDTLSLGYFQRYDDVPAVAHASRVVRRITGGGAIHHDAGELTFSLTAPATHPLYAGPVPRSYARVHAAVIDALAAFGVHGRLRGAQALASDRAGTGMCFHESTPLDVAWLERKGVGSAQRRRNGRVLHHGSIKLRAGAQEEGVASCEAAGVRVGAAELGDALAASLADSAGLVFERGEVSRTELREARERGARYLDPQFLRRR